MITRASRIVRVVTVLLTLLVVVIDVADQPRMSPSPLTGGQPDDRDEEPGSVAPAGNPRASRPVESPSTPSTVPREGALAPGASCAGPLSLAPFAALTAAPPPLVLRI